MNVRCAPTDFTLSRNCTPSIPPPHMSSRRISKPSRPRLPYLVSNPFSHNNILVFSRRWRVIQWRKVKGKHQEALLGTPSACLTSRPFHQGFVNACVCAEGESAHSESLARGVIELVQSSECPRKSFSFLIYLSSYLSTNSYIYLSSSLYIFSTNVCLCQYL